MPAGRPAVPAALQRDVRVEAGHRCAIPTCRATSGLQIHHIIDWVRVKEHRFENLILLCANCHSRVTAGEIDRRSVRAYKANLGLMVGRYGDLERRVLEHFISDRSAAEVTVDMGHAVLLKYLVDDGLLSYLGPADGAFIFEDPLSEGVPVSDATRSADHYGPGRWALTEAGRELVGRLRDAQHVE
jgi:HNH endonuclease